MTSGTSTNKQLPQASLSFPAMWVPNLRLSRAAALSVPRNLPYQEAIRDKVVALLEAAGEAEAKRAVQAYLEPQEQDILGRQFPEEWAVEILASPQVSLLVMSGDPESVDPAPPELSKEALEENKELNLATFLSLAPA